MPYKDRQSAASIESEKKGHKKYNATPNGKKINRIARWRQQGIIDTDFDELYAFVLGETNCMICDKKYKNSQDRHVDHDHEEGNVRYICCNYCNSHVIR